MEASEPEYVIRRLVAGDMGLVLSSWKIGLRKHPDYRDVDDAEFWPFADRITRRVLTSADTVVNVACASDDHGQILGYAISNPARDVLWWVYVKEAFRRLGVATKLMEPCRRPVFLPWWWKPRFDDAAKRHGLKHKPVEMCL